MFSYGFPPSSSFYINKNKYNLQYFSVVLCVLHTAFKKFYGFDCIFLLIFGWKSCMMYIRKNENGKSFFRSCILSMLASVVWGFSPNFKLFWIKLFISSCHCFPSVKKHPLYRFFAWQWQPLRGTFSPKKVPFPFYAEMLRENPLNIFSFYAEWTVFYKSSPFCLCVVW